MLYYKRQKLQVGVIKKSGANSRMRKFGEKPVSKLTVVSIDASLKDKGYSI